MKTRVLPWAVLAIAGLAACSESGDRYYRPIDKADYPAADGPGEKLADNEVESAARISAIIEARLRNLYPTGTIRRDAHPKADGCVKAVFTVLPGLTPPLDAGLFRRPGSYDAVIRFSNANEDPHRADKEADGRGMAIKVFDPPGTPLTVDPQGRPSQDFIMISHPTFLVSDPGDYRKLIGYVDSEDKLTQLFQPVLAFLSIGLTGTRNAVATTSLKIDNPLHTRYWSMVPYQLGASAVKFSAEPCAAAPAGPPPDDGDPDFLRHALAASLRPGSPGACMAFKIQPRTSDALSVEDSRFEWPEDQAPFHQVATITIPAQAFDDPEQNRACEHMSYSPWHALPEQKPLGAVNRMRKVIYERISAIRRESETAPPPNRQ